MSRIKVYMGVMPKHLTKISKFGGQHRLTIPKLLIEELGWKDVEYVIVEGLCTGVVQIRRFMDGEDLKTKDAGDRPGSDR
jgi:hypothetical protein